MALSEIKGSRRVRAGKQLIVYLGLFVSTVLTDSPAYGSAKPAWSMGEGSAPHAPLVSDVQITPEWVAGRHLYTVTYTETRAYA